MMKLQTKMSNTSMNIQKLAKGLNKFTKDDVLIMLSLTPDEINTSLKELETNNIIKKISKNEYLYIKYNSETFAIKKEVKDLNPITYKDSTSIWLTVVQVATLTGLSEATVAKYCKIKKYVSKLKMYESRKKYLIQLSSIPIEAQKLYLKKEVKTNSIDVSLVIEENQKFFKDEDEIKIFKEAPVWAKKYVIKYITVFKLAKNLNGNSLRVFLKHLKQENPDFKVSYTRYMVKKKEYLKYGIKGLLPKSKSSTKFFDKKIYEDFKKIYLSSNNYSIQKTFKILESAGYNLNCIPCERTFLRWLHKEYPTDVINKLRMPVYNLPNLEIIDETVQNKEIYDYFSDAASAYLKELSKNNEKKSLCAIGYLKNHLIPFFKKYKLKDITQTTVNDFIKLKISEGFTTSSTSIFISLLSKIKKQYSNYYGRFRHFNENIVENSIKTILSDIEINKEIKYIPALWVLMLGIKPVELMALTDEDIDLKNKTVIINKILYKNKISKYRRFYQIRTLKLPKCLLQTLNNKAKGIIFKDIKFKNADLLINTHIKLMLNKNIQINIIAKNLGYKSTTDFENRYNFLLPQQLDNDFELL